MLDRLYHNLVIIFAQNLIPSAGFQSLGIDSTEFKFIWRQLYYKVLTRMNIAHTFLTNMESELKLGNVFLTSADKIFIIRHIDLFAREATKLQTEIFKINCAYFEFFDEYMSLFKNVKKSFFDFFYGVRFQDSILEQLFDNKNFSTEAEKLEFLYSQEQALFLKNFSNGHEVVSCQYSLDNSSYFDVSFYGLPWEIIRSEIVSTKEMLASGENYITVKRLTSNCFQ